MRRLSKISRRQLSLIQLTSHSEMNLRKLRKCEERPTKVSQRPPRISYHKVSIMKKKLPLQRLRILFHPLILIILRSTWILKLGRQIKVELYLSCSRQKFPRPLKTLDLFVRETRTYHTKVTSSTV